MCQEHPKTLKICKKNAQKRKFADVVLAASARKKNVIFYKKFTLVPFWTIKEGPSEVFEIKNFPRRGLPGGLASLWTPSISGEGRREKKEIFTTRATKFSTI